MMILFMTVPPSLIRETSSRPARSICSAGTMRSTSIPACRATARTSASESASNTCRQVSSPGRKIVLTYRTDVPSGPCCPGAGGEPVGHRREAVRVGARPIALDDEVRHAATMHRCRAPRNVETPGLCSGRAGEFAGELRARSDVELAIDLGQGRLDGPLGHDQDRRDLLVRLALRHELGDPSLGGREAVAGRRSAADPGELGTSPGGPEGCAKLLEDPERLLKRPPRSRLLPRPPLDLALREERAGELERLRDAVDAPRGRART